MKGRLVSFALATSVAVATPALGAEVPEFLSTLVGEIRAAHEGGVENPTSVVEESLARFLASGELPDEYRRPLPGLDVTTYMLYVAPDASFSIAALVLRQGATTPLHDHHTWTVWGTLTGRDREVRWEREGDLEGPFPKLRRIGERNLPKDGISTVPLAPRDLHQVENVGEEPSVSVHVHGADMRVQTRYVYHPSRGVVSAFVQTYEGNREPEETADER